MSTPLVSVVMPSFRHGRFVREAVDSVLAQTMGDLEVILVEDCSPDDTQEICAGITDPRFHYHRLPQNSGSSVALNTGISHMRGQFFAILDSDDRYHPDKLARQLAVLRERPEVGAVFTLPRFIDEAGHPVPVPERQRRFLTDQRPRHEWVKHLFETGGFLCSGTILMRAGAFDRVGTFDPRFLRIPDIEFHTRLLLHEDIHVLAEPLYDYRRLQSQENVSGTSWPAWFQARLEYHALKDNLLKLTDPADFLKTFPLFLEQAPALRDDPSLLTDDLRLFLVASYALAIEKETPTGQAELSREHALFGLNVLYDLYEDPTHARQLEQLFDVGYPQLADMAAQHPIFGTDPHPPVSEP